MGGRGSSSGLSGGGRNSVIDSKAKTRTIETEYKKGGGLWRRVLQIRSVRSCRKRKRKFEIHVRNAGKKRADSENK